MKEITLYQAEDGRIFDNLSDCSLHEITERIKNTGIKMYDKNGKAFSTTTYLSDDTYNNIETIIISNEQDLEDIQKIYDYTGFYYGIDRIGTWVWDDKEQKFIISVTR